MKHPLIGARQTLAASLVILMGLSAYGCGDTASTTEPAVLGNLSVTEGTLEPPFNPATTSYIVQLPISIASTTITATPRIAGDTIRIDNQQITSQTVSLSSPGAEQTINIVVTDTGTGGTSRSYSVRVTRATLNGNNSLSNLIVSQGTLAPEFEAGVLRYTASVANTIGSVNVTPTLSDPAATMTVNGQATNSGQTRTINLNGGGQTTTITIAITAQNGIPKSYEIVVSRGPSNNNNLRGLTISPGTLNFRASTTSYTVNVGNSVPSVTLRPTLADATASMTVNGEAATSGQSRTITLTGTGPGSPTVITIIVIAQNGSPKPYSVSVVRAALGGNNNLSALTISSGSLAFEEDTLTYTVNVGSSISSVNVSATKADPNATMSEDVAAPPGTATGQATISLGGPGSTTVVLIAVSAPNGNSKTYRINVIKAALGSNSNLSSLRVQPGSLNFDANTLTYTVNVDSTVEQVEVSARKADRNATMALGSVTVPAGTAAGQATFPLNGAGGDPTPISVTVTAQNGVNTQTYVISVNRAALGSNSNLSSLTVQPGSLNFDANTLTYTVNVDSTVEQVEVSARKADRNATMALGSVTVAAGTAAGQATFPLNGAGGAPTPISVTVTAQNGVNTQTYSITVNRAAASTKPPAPTSAADLIKADDSCPLVEPPDPNNPDPDGCVPGTSKTDNITNVKIPRFRIPKPATGESPSLYIDGNKDASASFDTGSNRLQPSADLSDGDHTITYTLTNTVGESDSSPALTVTISTVAPQQ